jgi:hypothetical protein
LEEILGIWLATAGFPREEVVVAERSVAEHVDPEDAEGLGGPARLPEDDLAVDDWRDVAVFPYPHQVGQPLLVHAETRADDFQRSLS